MMFRSLLPSRRDPTTDFQMLTGPIDSAPNGKENHPGPSQEEPRTPRPEKMKKRKSKDNQSQDSAPTGEAFEQLLDELQVPDNMREKLATMNPSVKAAFLKSSREMSVMQKPTGSVSSRGVRKARSSESLGSSRSSINKHGQVEALSRAPDRPKFMTVHKRGVSFDASRAALLFPTESALSLKLPKEVRLPRKRGKSISGTAAKWCTVLMSVSTVQLEVETVKKLRLLLRNESTSWTQEFLQHGGYAALLTRLNEILNIEWREEQHDDQILHELLRCIKALSTSSIGCIALRAKCPEPYEQLMSLLYSDKRPGEVATRQLIIELLLILFDLYPPSSLPSTGSPAVPNHPYGHARNQSTPWVTDSEDAPSSNLVTLPAPHASFFSFIRSLLLTPAPPAAEETGPAIQPHNFIEEIHVPRIYKTYMEELNNVCRDYFWVFCHPNNCIWNVDETDEEKVEKPRAPGGMTGGVEFEAMTYMTTHFRFLNAVSRSVEDLGLPRNNELSAYRFHSDMFVSGMERIVLMGRKASTTYYPTLHLEIARYVAAAARSGFELPWQVSRHMGPPPSNMRKNTQAPPPRPPPRPKTPSKPTKASGSVPGSPVPASPTRKTFMSSGSVLPGVRKVTPMFGH
ncbi:hypothetical protein WOLCODRAFT_141240 [Wolfiporia cocos MD-104 SS10]|uniref:Formin GTPase-binding domain-containing protein n=1 Tax=Wolfiporia cocos (strain MD-104) TaxID=742152 RepID=A0A2H3JCT8_WOLCO|nr:hypothetical protein WOLCODRAFT_141240 [Wolfiporia cocos MD-104 SS10]